MLMSVNKVILIGNVGRDPEVRHLEGNRTVANFSLATRETYRDRNGNRQELTEWHSIELWVDLAKSAERFVKKGKLIYLEGKIRTNSWTDRETGAERSNKIIRCNVMTFLNTGGQQGGSKDANLDGNNEQINTNHEDLDGDEHSI